MECDSEFNDLWRKQSHLLDHARRLILRLKQDSGLVTAQDLETFLTAEAEFEDECNLKNVAR